MKAAVRDFFDRYKKANEVYVAAGRLFLTRAAAESNYFGSIAKVTRAEAMADDKTAGDSKTVNDTKEKEV